MNLEERLDKHLQNFRESNELLKKFKPYAKINNTASDYEEVLKEGGEELYYGYVGKEIYTIITDSLLDNSFDTKVLQKVISSFNEAEDKLLDQAYDATPDREGNHYYSWDTIDDIRGTFSTIKETVEILKKVNTKTAKQYINGLQKLLPKINKLWDKIPEA